MKIIKLDAINSTNSFLKELCRDYALENFTIAVTNEQTNGRGQQSNTWESEPFKNLTASIFITELHLDIINIKYLSFTASLAVYDLLSDYNIPNISIKWPNDIMSANKKLCGILVDNRIKNQEINSCIVGFGLNVNQEKFPEYLDNATSLTNLTNLNYNLDDLLTALVSKMENRIQQLTLKDFIKLEEDYLDVLYRIETPSLFKDKNGVLFMGIIKGISDFGNLLVELEGEIIAEFGIKEISFV
ncbi:biotin--[acetyl-CoA-carboxylase] ligase [Polaribacter reichenbachii]|uniref:Biotin--[acetyl-CoA-carboxylase] synthetase n=1 Tax=Polaribacter reichenbachii TaxID=996801 RepID=A0A1B8U4Z6_9FLAO|nr:biotin--[acetyl-CoA-carboxylase] ligase [Polaribacter reichenbachii]APZ44784.1 biotin--[acetyl-CoA-carboxylase] ligase [Polaribacter reichenbachii]AUC18648.1 biotin--[acetyl-CoA-carboxylase] ligase [Polaribacter reichenbachii]OBY66943.1 biotin--[acetyl-CoA-carboxylase] synthetase [Polaribacter reichenbachii]